MTKNGSLLLLIGLGLILAGCGLQEGTIVYDQDYPKADSCESTGSCDSGGSGSGGVSSAGFTLSQTTATVSETGSTDSFSIVLNNSPTADVSFSLSDTDSDNSELSLSATSLTFGTGNWSTAQTITLTGLDDNDLDGDVVSTVTVSVSSSADTNYAGLSAQTVSVTTQDDELASVTWDAVTPGEQQIELTWLAYSGASSYTIYWNTSGSVDNNSSSFSEISGTASTSCPGGAASCLSYIHGGLNSSAYYYYRIVANVSGKLTELSTEENALPRVLSCTPSYTPDTDSDLLVYYDFDDSSGEGLHDKSPDNGRPDSAWPYDLTNITSWKSYTVSDSVRFMPGCASGDAAYFDSTTGYLVNEHFDNGSISALNDNYTVSMWLYPETSGTQGRIALVSGFNPGGPDFQLEYKESTSYFEWNAHEKIKVTSYPAYQWYHVTLVKHDNGTGSIYVNGALASSINNHSTGWDLIGMGISRSRGTAGQWKGYIDEVKVYGKSLDETQICNLYKNDGPNNTGATCP
jgi:hypothetical protein